MAVQFDAKDAELLHARQLRRDALTVEPRVGDFVRMKDGRLLRFTYNWGDDIQTTINGDVSFYLGNNGHCDFSGSLDHAILKKDLRDTGEKKDGSVWFFHHDISGAHRGVYCQLSFRVWEQI